MERFKNSNLIKKTFTNDVVQGTIVSIQQRLRWFNMNVNSTVNRGDFGQIFTIFKNIFIMMNSILGFIWGLVNTMY